MKTALVVGSTGTIGSAIYDAFSNAGYQVQGVSRKSDPALDISNPGSINNFFAPDNSYDVIVCAAGWSAHGSLDKLDEEEFQKSFNSKLMGQIRLVKHGLPRLNNNGTIILTGGSFAHDPWPETSAMAFTSAGLQGFVKAVALETRAGKRVCIVHPPFIAETAEKLGMDSSPWPGAAAAAATYLKAALEDRNGQALYLVGFHPRSD